MPNLADLVRQERRRQGWTQYDLAALANVSQNTISAIERRSRVTDLDKLYSIALAFADGDKERAGVWLYRMITAAGYPLHAPPEVEQ
jgi:transcriptional regulator with XRE-family HTH domain